MQLAGTSILAIYVRMFGNVACGNLILFGVFFFQVLVEIFSTYFSTRDEYIRRVSRKIVEKIEK